METQRRHSADCISPKGLPRPKPFYISGDTVEAQWRHSADCISPKGLPRPKPFYISGDTAETQRRHSGDTVETVYHQRGCPALNLFISQWRLRLSVSTRTLAVSISVGGEGISCLQIFHPLPFPYSLTIFSEVKPSFSTYLQISHHGVGGACHVL